MGTHVENLKSGDWITVVGHRELDDVDREPQMVMGMFGPQMSGPARKPDYSGNPVKILAISLPFICVTDGQGSEALDIRKIVVQKVSLKYVKAMMKGKGRRLYQQQNAPATLTLSSTDEVADRFNLPELKNIVSTEGEITLEYPKTCPVCHEGVMVENLTEGEREWKLTCPNCGFEGTRPKKGGDDTNKPD